MSKKEQAWGVVCVCVGDNIVEYKRKKAADLLLFILDMLEWIVKPKA